MGTLFEIPERLDCNKLMGWRKSDLKPIEKMWENSGLVCTIGYLKDFMGVTRKSHSARITPERPSFFSSSIIN